jgi:hypothetical protein
MDGDMTVEDKVELFKKLMKFSVNKIEQFFKANDVHGLCDVRFAHSAVGSKYMLKVCGFIVEDGDNYEALLIDVDDYVPNGRLDFNNASRMNLSSKIICTFMDAIEEVALSGMSVGVSFDSLMNDGHGNFFTGLCLLKAGATLEELAIALDLMYDA